MLASLAPQIKVIVVFQFVGFSTQQCYCCSIASSPRETRFHATATNISAYISKVDNSYFPERLGGGGAIITTTITTIIDATIGTIVALHCEYYHY